MSLETTRVGVLLLAVLAALAIGVLLRRRTGRAVAVAGGARLSAAELAAPLGRRATVVQFSAPACAPCRSTRRVLGELADRLPGVVHVELDAAAQLDLTRRLGVVRTPTVLVLDPAGTVRRRASGALGPLQARQAIADLVPEAVVTPPADPRGPDVRATA